MTAPSPRADFLELMGEALVGAVDREPSSTFGVWRDGTLAFVSGGWSRMAFDNNGAQVLREWPLGRSVWEAVPDVLQGHYRDLWRRVLESQEACEHEYECSSPERKRIYRMQLHPLTSEGLLIRNQLVVDLPRQDPGAALRPEIYASDAGFLTMCANCRRVRRALEPAAWDWVPDLVRAPPARLSHGLCEPCLEIYFPEGGPRSL